MSYMSGAVMAIQSDCGSSGGAMYDPPAHDPVKYPWGPYCFLMYAPPIIIGDTYMSIMRGFQQVNIAFHTWGGGGGRSTVAPDGLPGPVIT